MIVSLIAALDEDGAIGRARGLPWRLPDDLRRFKRLTIGKPVIMGRRTWDSIGRPLPRRHNIVLTRRHVYDAESCTIARTPDEALAAAAPAAEVMIIGGAAVYAVFLPLAQRFHMTRVHGHIGGDTYFPLWNRDEWLELERSFHPADERHEYSFSFITLERRTTRPDTRAE